MPTDAKRPTKRELNLLITAGLDEIFSSTSAVQQISTASKLIDSIYSMDPSQRHREANRASNEINRSREVNRSNETNASNESNSSKERNRSKERSKSRERAKSKEVR